MSGSREGNVKKYRSVKYGNEVITANSCPAFRVRLKEVGQLAHLILKKLKFRKISLSLVFVSDSVIQRLNRLHLRHSWITDVLAFPFTHSPGRKDRGGMRSFLGEVIIAPRQAKVNAKRFGVSFKEELARYISHGILHFQGYSDHSKHQQKRMRRLESKLLKPLASQIRKIV